MTPGNKALGLPCFASHSLHVDACFPNASSNWLSFSLTFVKPLLLLRVNLSALKMACSFYLLSLIEMWTVRAYSLSQRILSRIPTPIWLLLLGKKKNLASGSLTNSDYAIVISHHRNKSGHTRSQGPSNNEWRGDCITNSTTARKRSWACRVWSTTTRPRKLFCFNREDNW